MAIWALAGAEPISALASRHGVSRPLVYHGPIPRVMATCSTSIRQFETLVNISARIASGVRSERETLEARLANPRRRCQDSLLIARLAELRSLEARAHRQADDLRTLARWLERDVLALAGPDRATRQELFDFVVDELHQREPEAPSRIGTMRGALQNQRDDLLAFAGVLDEKRDAIARATAVPGYLVRATCLPHRKPETSRAFWQA
jgi:hypothetical protein